MALKVATVPTAVTQKVSKYIANNPQQVFNAAAKGSEAIRNVGRPQSTTTSQKSSTPGTSMGGNVSAPTTVYTTSAAQRSANAAAASTPDYLKNANVATPLADAAYNARKAEQDAAAWEQQAANELYNAPITDDYYDGGGGGSTRGSGSSGGGGGYSTASLIGNLITDPTAEIRSRYAGILADLANNNQYVLDKLKGNYNTSVNTINADYDTALNRQNQDAENALREAYINMMLNRKNMASDMSRMGYNGGVTESNQARMYNNYGNIRNSIRNTLANALENLNLKRNASLGEALNQYNAQLADQASDYFNKKQNYETALANAIANLTR